MEGETREAVVISPLKKQGIAAHRRTALFLPPDLALAAIALLPRKGSLPQMGRATELVLASPSHNEENEEEIGDGMGILYFKGG